MYTFKYVSGESHASPFQNMVTLNFYRKKNYLKFTLYKTNFHDFAIFNMTRIPRQAPPYIYICIYVFLCSIKAHLVSIVLFMLVNHTFFFFAIWVTKTKSSPCQRWLVIGFCANSDHKMKNGGIKNECFICKQASPTVKSDKSQIKGEILLMGN